MLTACRDESFSLSSGQGLLEGLEPDAAQLVDVTGTAGSSPDHLVGVPQQSPAILTDGDHVLEVCFGNKHSPVAIQLSSPGCLWQPFGSLYAVHKLRLQKLTSISSPSSTLICAAYGISRLTLTQTNIQLIAAMLHSLSRCVEGILGLSHKAHAVSAFGMH